MPLVSGEITVDGVMLSYLERQASEGVAGAPIVLLHGVAASAWTLEGLIGELPQDRRVVALNLPGSEVAGRRSQSDVSLRGSARLVCDFAEMMGLEHPVVLGHSHGGAIALQIAVCFPELASGLILLCPAHPFLLRERPLVAFYNSWAGHLLAHSLRLIPMGMQGVGFNRLLGPAGRRAGIDFRPYREPFQRRDNVDQILRLLKTWSADMDALGVQLEQHKIATPTLFLWGDHDPVVPIETAPTLQRHIQTWEQVTLHDVGHLPADEATEECGCAIRSWLAKQDGGV